MGFGLHCHLGFLRSTLPIQWPLPRDVSSLAIPVRPSAKVSIERETTSWADCFSCSKSAFVPSSYQPVDLPDDTPKLFADLWKPYLHKLNDTNFVTDEGYTYRLAEGAQRFSTGLGKKLLILDVDTRLDLEQGSMFSDQPLHFNNMTGRSGGQMNHYMYGGLKRVSVSDSCTDNRSHDSRLRLPLR